MHIYMPDPHPGRCNNYRTGFRCLDYEGSEHVCTFDIPEKLPASRSWTSRGSTFATPAIVPWVKPEVPES